MLNKIKEIKLSKIKDELDKYESAKKEIEDLNKEIEEIGNMKRPEQPLEYIVPLNYGLLSRILFKRKEYLEKKKEKEDGLKAFEEKEKEYESKKSSLDSLIKKRDDLISFQGEHKDALESYKKITESKNIKELGLSFEEAVLFLKENNEDIILDESDLDIIINESNFDKKEDFCLVHKTMYEPSNSEIKPALVQGIKKTKSTIIDGEEFTVSYNIGRNTVHVCLNGEVKSHELGHFDGRDYAIIMPFDKIDDSNLLSLRGEDTFFEGALKIQGGYILCTKEHIEEARKNNPGVTIIGIDNENVDGYANAFLSMLGYKYEKVGKSFWLNEKDQKKLELFAGNNKYRQLEHNGSMQSQRENVIESYSQIIGFIETLKEKMSQGKIYDIDKLLELAKEDRWVLKDGKRTGEVLFNVELSISDLIDYTKDTIFMKQKCYQGEEAVTLLEDCFGEKLDSPATSSVERNLNYLFYKLKTLYDIDVDREMLYDMIKDNPGADNLDELHIFSDQKGKLDEAFMRNIISELYKKRDLTEEYSEGITR